MAKYLSDVMFRCPILQKEEGNINNYQNEYGETLLSVNFIEFLFNRYIGRNEFPTNHGIWRYIVFLNPEKNGVDIYNNTFTEVMGIQQKFDNELLISKNKEERKKLLLDIFTEGLIALSQLTEFDESIFLQIKNKILADNITYNKPHKDAKKSPNKQKKAQIWGTVTETETIVYIVIKDIKNGEEIKIFINEDKLFSTKSFLFTLGDYSVFMFDKITWINNEIIHLYHINGTESYKRKKVCKDYFEINILTKTVIYCPQTKQPIFDYGCLLLFTEEHDKGIDLLKRAQAMGHGKVANILLNLEMNSKNRDIAQLMQMPKQRNVMKLIPPQ